MESMYTLEWKFIDLPTQLLDADTTHFLCRILIVKWKKERLNDSEKRKNFTFSVWRALTNHFYCWQRHKILFRIAVLLQKEKELNKCVHFRIKLYSMEMETTQRAQSVGKTRKRFWKSNENTRKMQQKKLFSKYTLINTCMLYMWHILDPHRQLFRKL